jgi:uncharacterized protein YjiS (DUF1127 family)
MEVFTMTTIDTCNHPTRQRRRGLIAAFLHRIEEDRRMRRDARILSGLSDQILRDIGLRRDDIADAVRNRRVY